MKQIVIRPIFPEDYALWLPLWNGNNQGLENEAITKSTWERLNDPNFPIYGFLALKNGKAAGLLHYVLHPTTGNLKNVCYMQDVFVSPDFRRGGLAKALIAALAEEGKRQDWARVYWLAESANMAAQNLYQSLGIRLDFTLHMMPLGR
ncbi:MAG: GNAT family N-acetyltransferase [Alphaproteobacteria bacterium]|nr:GNAT family N-acetyltransferase [Alphaproteobacteria bacterium]